MKRTHLKQFSLTLGAIFGAISLTLAPASALQATTDARSTEPKSTEKSGTPKLIITRGDNEINRRLNSLKELSKKVNAAEKLSASDKSTLSSEVNDETSNLTSLKTKLDADTDESTAKTDTQSIITNYRVYALVLPKVNLVKSADDQLTAETKLTTLAAKLQSRLTAAQHDGKAVTSLQNTLTDLTNKTAAAQAISTSVRANVIGLQPSDYNNAHTVLNGDWKQLKTAQGDIQAAINDAQTIISGLKNL